MPRDRLRAKLYESEGRRLKVVYLSPGLYQALGERASFLPRACFSPPMSRDLYGTAHGELAAVLGGLENAVSPRVSFRYSVP